MPSFPSCRSGFYSPKAWQQCTPLVQKWRSVKTKIAIICNCVRKISFNLILALYG